MKASKKMLEDRWRSEAGVRLGEEVVARLLAGRRLDDLDLDEVDGRVDLRHLRMPPPRRLQRFASEGWFIEQLTDLIRFRAVALRGLDLSGADLQSLRFDGATIEDCVFEGSLCRDWRLWDTTVRRCSFARSDLRGAVVGSWEDGRRNMWDDVDFTRADFRVGVSLGALYTRCDFIGAKVVGVSFDQCDFVDCRFSGLLRRVTFDGRALEDRPPPGALQRVSFVGSVFDEVEFMGLKLDEVILPEDPDLRLVSHYGCVIDEVLRAVSGADSVEARMLVGEFENRRRARRASDEDNIVNRRDYAASGADFAACALRVIAEAEKRCLGNPG
jgi:uncharacterized protein YjbI with pentapeptide repeats